MSIWQDGDRKDNDTKWHFRTPADLTSINTSVKWCNIKLFTPSIKIFITVCYVNYAIMHILKRFEVPAYSLYRASEWINWSIYMYMHECDESSLFATTPPQRSQVDGLSRRHRVLPIVLHHGAVVRFSNTVSPTDSCYFEFLMSTICVHVHFLE